MLIKILNCSCCVSFSIHTGHKTFTVNRFFFSFLLYWFAQNRNNRKNCILILPIVCAMYVHRYRRGIQLKWKSILFNYTKPSLLLCCILVCKRTLSREMSSPDCTTTIHLIIQFRTEFLLKLQYAFSLLLPSILTEPGKK